MYFFLADSLRSSGTNTLLVYVRATVSANVSVTCQRSKWGNAM